MELTLSFAFNNILVKCIEYSSAWAPTEAGTVLETMRGNDRVSSNRNTESLSVMNAASPSVSATPRKGCSFGHPDLHRLLAINFWQEKNFSDARYHFIHSTGRSGTMVNLIIIYN